MKTEYSDLSWVFRCKSNNFGTPNISPYFCISFSLGSCLINGLLHAHNLLSELILDHPQHKWGVDKKSTLGVSDITCAYPVRTWITRSYFFKECTTALLTAHNLRCIFSCGEQTSASVTEIVLLRQRIESICRVSERKIIMVIYTYVTYISEQRPENSVPLRRKSLLFGAHGISASPMLAPAPIPEFFILSYLILSYFRSLV